MRRRAGVGDGDQACRSGSDRCYGRNLGSNHQAEHHGQDAFRQGCAEGESEEKNGSQNKCAHTDIYRPRRAKVQSAMIGIFLAGRSVTKIRERRGSRRLDPRVSAGQH